MDFESIWTGFGSVVEERGYWVLRPKAAENDEETHSAMVLSTSRVGGKFSILMRTMKQLRIGHPNSWEVAWAIISAQDRSHFYYTLITRAGVEVGYFDDEDMIAFATARLPVFQMGREFKVAVDLRETSFAVRVNEDPKIIVARPIPVGMVGGYVEDSIGSFKFEVE